MSCLKTVVMHWYAQLELKAGYVACNSWNLSAFGPAKRSGPTLLSTVP